MDNSGDIHFLDMRAITQQAEDARLKIFYDTNLGAYHIQSDKPLLIDADLKVGRSSTTDFDEYSSVMIDDNPVTTFKKIVGTVKMTVCVDYYKVYLKV